MRYARRSKLTLLAAMLGIAALAVWFGIDWTRGASASPQRAPLLAPSAAAGATLPFVEIQAEDTATNGTLTASDADQAGPSHVMGQGLRVGESHETTADHTDADAAHGVGLWPGFRPISS